MYSGEKSAYRSKLLERRKNKGIALAGNGKALKRVSYPEDNLPYKSGGIIVKKAVPQLQDRVDVITPDGSTFPGVVDSYTDSTMVIGRQIGDFRLPVIPEGTKLTLKHYILDKGYEVCNCIVVKSNIIELSVAGVEISDEVNRRSSLRVRVYSAKAEIYESKIDYLKNKIPCTLVDINMNGAKISCAKEYQEGSTLLLRVELYPDAGFMTLPSVISRCDMVDGKFEYGVLFAELDEEKKRNLQLDLKEAMYFNSR